MKERGGDWSKETVRKTEKEEEKNRLCIAPIVLITIFKLIIGIVIKRYHSQHHAITIVTTTLIITHKVSDYNNILRAKALASRPLRPPRASRESSSRLSNLIVINARGQLSMPELSS